MNMKGMLPQIFHGQIELMKDMLERGEMIYGGDRENPGYKRFKQETMKVHYNAIDAFWTLLQEKGLTEKCDCDGMARRWTDCEFCGGSGFKVKTEEVPDVVTVAAVTISVDSDGNPIVPDLSELQQWAEERGLKLVDSEEVPDGPTTDPE